MKPGMKIVQRRQVKDRWVWLCEEQGCREWATYVSVSPDAACTEYGHYFVTESSAIQDYQARLNSI
jgi:hypothetical protein